MTLLFFLQIRPISNSQEVIALEDLKASKDSNVVVFFKGENTIRMLLH